MGYITRIAMFILVAGLTMVPAFVGCDEDAGSDSSLLLLMALQPTKIYIYSGGIHNGNFDTRSNADSLCATAASANPTVKGKRVKKAFISFSGTDQIKDVVPQKYAALPVYGVKADGTETLLKDSWSNLWTSTGINDTLGNATGIGTDWWTGSFGTGLYVNPANSCLAWTCKDAVCDPVATGNAGQYDDATTVNWVTDVAWGCDAIRSFLCVAY